MTKPSYLAILCILIATILPASLAADIYVSPTGSDSNSGSIDQPLATLAAAQQKAREIAGKSAVTVHVADGTYHLSAPLAFTSEDSGTAQSPVTYRAMPGADVVLKGSQPLTANNWKPWKDGIYQQSLAGTSLAGREINQLFMSNKRMVRARFPNWDYVNPLRSGKGYFQTDGSDKTSMEQLRWAKGDLESRVGNWKNPELGIVHAFHSCNWGNFQFRIGKIDAENRLIHFSEGGWQAQRRERGVGAKHRGRPGSPFYVENILEELDTVSEWYHDQETDTLYFKPPAGVELSKSTVEAAVLSQIIEVDGAEHLHFEGFHLTQTRATFMDAYEDLARGDWAIHRGGAVYFTNCENCSVKDFHIEQIGGNGIFVELAV